MILSASLPAVLARTMGRPNVWSLFGLGFMTISISLNAGGAKPELLATAMSLM